MVGRRSFPIGVPAYSQGRTVSLREGKFLNIIEPNILVHPLPLMMWRRPKRYDLDDWTTATVQRCDGLNAELPQVPRFLEHLILVTLAGA